MTFARICILLAGLLASLGLSRAAEPRPPTTLAEAGRMEAPQGWSLAQMANGRPVALYRGPVGTGRFLALSCINNGRARLVGGPESYLVWGSKAVTRIITLHPEDARSYGAKFVLWLGHPAYSELSIWFGSDNVLDANGRNVLEQINKHCGDLNSSLPADDGEVYVRDDVVWETFEESWLNFHVPDSDAYLGLGLNCKSKKLYLGSNHVAKDAVDGGAADFTFRLDGTDMTFRAGVEDLVVNLYSYVTVSQPEKLLAALARAKTLQIVVKGWPPADIPTAGLNVLVPLALGDCMAGGAKR